MAQFLITTADEKTWRYDDPIVFLGDWCKIYDTRKKWENLNSQTVPPLLYNQTQKVEAVKYIQNQVEILLFELSQNLNLLHGTNYSLRYWNIVLGHWLRRYVDILYNRYFTMELALESYSFDKMVTYKNENKLIKFNSLGFILSSNDNIWNNLIYTLILKFKNPNFQFEEILIDENSITVHKKNIFSLKKILIKYFGKFSILFSSDKCAFIVKSYLSGMDELKLQIKLGQWPKIWTIPEPVKAPVDLNVRQKIQLNSSSYAGFEKFIRITLPEMIPTCYVEGYKDMVIQLKDLPFPKNPEFIFTSNCFDTDEIFKLWTADKAEKGVKYFVGQHGNNYGTHFLSGSSEWPDRKSSDKFFSWGWGTDNTKVVPAFNFKLKNFKNSKYNREGGLLLVEICMCSFLTAWDEYNSFAYYQEDQFLFVEELNTIIHNDLTVRLYGAYKDLQWCDEQRWKDRSPSTKLEKGQAKIQELITNSRLVVHSYDSTGVLETLALNIPTMCFWRNGFDHILPEAKADYEMLKKVGIYIEDPKELAQRINEIWDNIDDWWFSESVQNARQKFCDKYSKFEKNPSTKLSKLLKEALKEVKGE